MRRLSDGDTGLRVCDNQGMNDSTPKTIDDQFPNLVAYLDETDLRFTISQHTMTEAIQIEAALDMIETAMTLIHRNAEVNCKTIILDAILSIWDNSRDLAFDEDQAES